MFPLPRREDVGTNSQRTGTVPAGRAERSPPTPCPAHRGRRPAPRASSSPGLTWPCTSWAVTWTSPPRCRRAPWRSSPWPEAARWCAGRAGRAMRWARENPWRFALLPGIAAAIVVFVLSVVVGSSGMFGGRLHRGLARGRGLRADRCGRLGGRHPKAPHHVSEPHGADPRRRAGRAERCWPDPPTRAERCWPEPPPATETCWPNPAAWLVSAPGRTGDRAPR